MSPLHVAASYKEQHTREQLNSHKNLLRKERDSIQLFINGSMVTHKLSPSDCVGYEILSTLGSHGREMINSMTQGLRAGRDKLGTSQISREK